MKYIAILILISCSMDLMAQYADTKPRKIRVTDHISNTSHNRFIIDSMRMAIHDGRILKSQLNQGVIGNDFYSDFEIGMAQADNELRRALSKKIKLYKKERSF